LENQLYACLGSGNCYKPWLASKQLDIPLDVHLIDVLSGEQKSAEYLSINPLGVVPFFVTNTGISIGESNAMLWYLAEDTHLMPADPAMRAQALQWMFFEQTKLEPFISPARFFTTILPHLQDEKRTEIATWQTNAVPGLARLEQHLTTQNFMLPHGYSIADISLFGYVHVVSEAGFTLADYPSIAKWIDRVQATQNYQSLANLGHSQASLVA